MESRGQGRSIGYVLDDVRSVLGVKHEIIDPTTRRVRENYLRDLVDFIGAA